METQPILEALDTLTASVRDLLDVVKERELHPAGLVSAMEVRGALERLQNRIDARGAAHAENQVAISREVEALRRRVEEMDARLTPALSRTMKTVAEHDASLRAGRPLGTIQFPTSGATSGG